MAGDAGEDFNRNLGIADLDFATVHVYPSNWGVPNTAYTWVNDNWIGDRAALAAAARKPLLFEVRHRLNPCACCIIFAGRGFVRADHSLRARDLESCPGVVDL